MRAPFFRDRLKGIDLDRLDDPAVWAKIPLLTKDQLRQIPADRFHDEFCVAPRSAIVEYWRSGGVTGRPLFYPRSADDMEYSIACFRRAFVVIGATADDLVHVSFPLGIHPVAHLYARAAEDLGIGTIWCGSGSNTASLTQLELIRDSQADDLGRHGKLRLAPCQSRRSARLRPRRLLGAQDHRRGRAAVARQAPEARARLGRRSLRPVRHDRGRADLGAAAAAGRPARVVRPVPLRGGGRGHRRAGAGGRGRHAGR